MNKLLADPVFWGAIMALVGVVAGSFIQGWGRKKDYDLETLRASVEVLRAEYARLTAEVKELRESMSKAEKKHRQSMEKYSAALAWIVTVRTAWGGLKVRLAVVEFEHGEIPPIPRIIEADLPIDPVEDD